MATAIKRQTAASSQAHSEQPGAVVRAVDAVYRFLSSLKLAVFSIATLAATLAVGTFIERDYGTVAVQEWVYRSWWFAVLLAFLATNILCAALIRFPWKRRQTGFVITHTGLLCVLAGSFWSLQYADEGQVALTEGSKTTEMVRPDHPVIRVREVDPKTKKPFPDKTSYDQWQFHPGPLPWPLGRYEVLSDARVPYRLAAKTHLTASSPRYLHESVPEGMPMIRASLLAKPPNMLHATDAFEPDSTDSLHWLIGENRPQRAVRHLEPTALVFQFLDTDDKLQAFLHPPKELGPQGVVTFHYRDRTGQPRVEQWQVDNAQVGQQRLLPESDLAVRYEGLVAPRAQDEDEPNFPFSLDGKLRYLSFKVRKGDGPEVTHVGWESLPMLSSVPPGVGGREGPDEELVHIDYERPLPRGMMGLIEVVGMPDGRLYYRYRSMSRKDQPTTGELTLGKEIDLAGSDKMPMSVQLRVNKYLPSGRERLTYEQLDLEVGQLANAIPAAYVELTCDGEAREKWLRRSAGYEPDPRFIAFTNGRMFELAYDVDRKPMGFQIELDDFDVGLDPGTSEASSFRSDIRLTDEAHNIKDEPITISMNNTFSHNGWTFYQANYIPLEDENRQRTGVFMSVFQVGHDPGRPLKYAGCMLVVLGAFTQFYMRSGIFWFLEGSGKRGGKSGSKKTPVAPEEPSPTDVL